MEIVKACLDWFPCAVSLLCSLEAESVIVEPFAFQLYFLYYFLLYLRIGSAISFFSALLNLLCGQKPSTFQAHFH